LSAGKEIARASAVLQKKMEDEEKNEHKDEILLFHDRKYIHACDTLQQWCYCRARKKKNARAKKFVFLIFSSTLARRRLDGGGKSHIFREREREKINQCVWHLAQQQRQGNEKKIKVFNLRERIPSLQKKFFLGRKKYFQ
jgi:hypothetical protein